MNIMSYINLFLFAALLFVLFRNGRNWDSLSRKVLAGLIAGTVFGFYLQLVFGSEHAVTEETLNWVAVVGSSYVNLLRMIIMPLILVTMIAAVLKVDQLSSLGRVGGGVIAVLVVTAMIAALVGVLVTTLFGLSAEQLTSGTAELARAEVLEGRVPGIAALSIPDLLISFSSRNIFLDLTGARDVSVIAVVIFGLLFGIAALSVSEENQEQGKRIRQFIETAQTVVMKLVKIIMELTPYGVMALMTRVIAGSSGGAIVNLLVFLVASYLAIAVMFVIHGIIIVAMGRNLRQYIAAVWPVLSFAFVTRSSAATIPLTIRAQVEELNIPQPIANMAASFGATIGQNGCAGIYPAMLAVMVAPTMGINPLNLGFLVSLLLIVAVGSFGIAGVGGGATNAALVVLTTLGFPVTIAALLISIEPLIDMARTALNVNGSITAGVVADRFLSSGTETDQSTVKLI